jgi:hypothetical protein
VLDSRAIRAAISLRACPLVKSGETVCHSIMREMKSFCGPDAGPSCHFSLHRISLTVSQCGHLQSPLTVCWSVSRVRPSEQRMYRNVIHSSFVDYE